jgi:hypothetical protein
VKIGLSFSRCVRDIVEGKVDIADVLVVIARTDFNPNDDQQWESIWQGYAGGSNRGSMIRMFGGSNPEWSSYSNDDEDLFRSVSIELYDSGKLHQPRQFGAHPRRLPHYWLDTVLVDEDLDSKPAVKHAWEQYQILAGLSNTNIDKEHIA